MGGWVGGCSCRRNGGGMRDLGGEGEGDKGKLKGRRNMRIIGI
jgi:hypothetical protein